jgi:TolB protein
VGRIIFWTDRESIEGINITSFYVMNADGSEQELLDERPKCAAQLYSYFQKRLSIQSDGVYRLTVDRSSTGMDINMRDAGLHLVRRINSFYALSYDPAWSPDDSRIAFVSVIDGNDEIYVIAPESKQPERLTTNTWEWDKHPSWSPDGKEIAFTTNRATARKQLWIMRADGTEAHDISRNEFNDWDPIWVR